jgi:peptidoglycan/LPS O-acetylase OafA/YrhL
MPEITVFKMAIIAFFIALIVSILSWEFIEKKALRYKYK